MQVLASAVKFAAAFQETQMPLLRSMQILHAHHNAGVRRCAVAWALALLPYVARSQVSIPSVRRPEYDCIRSKTQLRLPHKHQTVTEYCAADLPVTLWGVHIFCMFAPVTSFLKE